MIRLQDGLHCKACDNPTNTDLELCDHCVGVVYELLKDVHEAQDERAVREMYEELGIEYLEDLEEEDTDDYPE